MSRERVLTQVSSCFSKHVHYSLLKVYNSNFVDINEKLLKLYKKKKKQDVFVSCCRCIKAIRRQLLGDYQAM